MNRKFPVSSFQFAALEAGNRELEACE